MTKRLLFALVVSLWIPCLGNAEYPVYFRDANLKTAVEETLWIPDPTPSDMLALTELRCLECEIRDLTGLEYAVNLQTLWLEDNLVTDISLLSGLAGLRTLSLEGNQVGEISVLSGLVNLQTLSLHKNRITDISPLTTLTHLRWLDLRVVPLGQKAYETDIPQIKANNPGMWIAYDPLSTHFLWILSALGGTVVSPGEGDLLFERDELIFLQAQPNPGFLFAKWSGDYSSTENPTSFTLDRDCVLRANFVSVRDVIWVNHSVPRDPKADGTPEKPFHSIQDAIDVSPAGATVLVAEGTYRETIDLQGKPIHLKSAALAGAGGTWPVIDGGGKGPVALFTRGEDSRCTMSGFVITGGKSQVGAAILCSGSGPRIDHCLIVGNRAVYWKGTVVHCKNSNATFTNCTIADNWAGTHGGSLCLLDSRAVVSDSILWGNAPREILIEGADASSIRYSMVAGSWPGQGNRDADPLFARRGRWSTRSNPNVETNANDLNAIWIMGDYHLLSQAGRWDPTTDTWLGDALTSPCIDAGDPATPIGQEPLPNGNIINMGTYGGTAEASRSPYAGSSW